MMERVLEKLDDLFSTKQTKYTGKRIFFTFCLVLLAGFSLPIYLKYEDYNYNRYLDQYQQATAIIQEYYSEYEVYPIGNPIDWSKEKNLNKFFTEKNFSRSRELYFIDGSLVPEINELRYTYIIDIDNGTLYTQEWVAYNFERWHLAVSF